MKKFIPDIIWNLRDGWLDGDGISPSQEGLRSLERVLGYSYPSTYPDLFIYPTHDGNIFIEWDQEDNPSLEVNLQDLSGEFSSLTIQEIKFDLKNKDDWDKILSLIKS